MDQLQTPTSQHRPAGWDEPPVVNQAIGMIAVRDDITPEQALSSLRRYAASTDQLLIAVSNAIVARSIKPELDHTPQL